MLESPSLSTCQFYIPQTTVWDLLIFKRRPLNFYAAKIAFAGLLLFLNLAVHFLVNQLKSAFSLGSVFN